jgi:hypothetical protein
MLVLVEFSGMNWQFIGEIFDRKPTAIYSSFNREPPSLKSQKPQSFMRSPIDSDTSRCIRWLSSARLYDSDDWPSLKDAMVSDYLNLAATFDLSHWHLKDFPASTDSAMLDIHFDVLRLERVFEHFVLPASILCRRMERILYILGSLCPATAYKQGFNELLAPVYYVLSSAKGICEDDMEIEALAFHLLHALLTQTRLIELFATQDESSMLIHWLRKFEGLVARHVPGAAEVIQSCRIHPMCYCYRWFSLLFAQEYSLEDVVLLWDEIFARIDVTVEFALYVGLAHLKQMEERMEMGDFCVTMHVLQKAGECDLRLAMDIAAELWEKDHAQKRHGYRRLMPAVLACARSLLSYVV